MMEKDKNIDELLGRIQKLETPPYLFTRIQAKLENVNELIVSKPKVALVGALFTLLLLINFMVLNFNVNQVQSDDVSVVAHDFGFTTTNQLYNE